MKDALLKFWSEASTSLQYRNIKFYCAGAVISLFGSMMQESMIAWVAFKLTGSTAVLGTIMSCYMLPMIVASIPGGWVADRFNRKRVVMCTQAIAMMIALAYVVMAATGTITMGSVYVLSAMLGVTVAFEMSSRMAMLPNLVDNPQHIGNAFALDSLIFYSCRLCGPAIGAIFLMAGNPAWGFGVNVASYALELCFLSQIKPAAVSGKEDKASLKEAFVFAYGNARRRQVMVLLAITTFFGVYIQLMPAFTAMRHGNALTNGFLIFASEIGAVVASLLIANKLADASRIDLLRRSIGWAGVIFALCLGLFALTQAVWLSLLLMIPVGFAMSAIFSGAQAVLQVEVEDRVRGAFTAMFYNFSYFGMLAIGGPVLGFLAARYGLTATTCGAAVCCLLASVHYLYQDKKQTH
jgi:MFS family permease